MYTCEYYDDSQVKTSLRMLFIEKEKDAMDGWMEYLSFLFIGRFLFFLWSPCPPAGARSFISD